MITIDGTGLVTGGTLRSPGNVINVAQEFKTDTAYVDNTGPAIGTDLIFLDYAATSSSSKLLILANMYVSNQNQNRMFGYLYVGGSVSAAIGDAAGNRARVSLGGEANFDSNDTIINLTHNYLLSSPSTSSTRYSYRFHHENTSNDRATYINQSHSDSNTSDKGRCTSSITIMEIAA